MLDENPDETRAPQRRQVVDLVAILIGLSLIGAALWDWGGLIERAQGTEIRHADALWAIELVSGCLAIASVILAQWRRWRTVGQLLTAVAGVMLILGLFFFSRPGWRAWVAFALPGLALVGLSRFLGPIPPPGPPSARRTGT
jgi:hypothetical protein